jgi:hypothetical protein
LRYRCLYVRLAERLDNFVVGVTDESPATAPPALANISGICGYGPAAATAGQTILVQCAIDLVPARYIVILNPNTVLTVCEVEVYDKPCTQSLFLVSMMLVKIFINLLIALMEGL